MTLLVSNSSEVRMLGDIVGVPASVTFRINTVGGRVIDKTLHFTIKQQ